MAKVTKIAEGSVCEGKINIGDDVLGFNGREFVDILDYIYADGLDEGVIKVSRDGEEFEVKYEKDGTLGLEFDESVEITPIECSNNCIFCFVRQLPEGLRDTLYVKDDDYRLSFISGSYITCTNLKEKDIERIIAYKLSPLYLSVHATDEEVRKYMLGIKRCAPQLELIKRFVAAGITIHSQIVLVGGINDGEVLRKSLRELCAAGVKTVAVVPVGLTVHREGLSEIQPLTKEQASAAIDEVERYYSIHRGFCYCSDEMYQIAEREVKPGEYYGNYDQIENGVGLIAKFFDELNYALSISPKRAKKRKIAVITGVSANNVIKKAAALVTAKYPKIDIEVCPVSNKFFGETVTVTGLVTAGDIISQYGDRVSDKSFVMVPSVMLKEFGDVFLDDVSVQELSEKLNKKIVVSHADGEGFLRAILNGVRKKW